MDKGMKGSICSSFKRVSYEQFEWKLDNFSSLEDTSYHASPRFNFSGHMWYIRFHPNLRSPYFGMYLCSTNVASPIFIYFICGVKRVDGCIEQWFSSHKVYTSDTCWGTDAAIDKSEFLRRELVCSDLNIVIIMSTRSPQLIKDALDQSFHLKGDDDERTSYMTGSEKVLSDIRKLFVTEDKSDVVISVQDTEFKVHRAILAARIPVLSNMFQHETLEKASNKINITDCEPAIFKEFLFYVYTGEIQNPTADNMLHDLYRVADKYLVDDLKLLCRKHIQNNLRDETFCDTIELAQRYEDKDIFKFAFDYFAIHFRSIIRREEWLRYLQENTFEANEILIESFGSP